MNIKMYNEFWNFAEDKDKAKALRINKIIPQIEKQQYVTLDFDWVSNATQSFLHALLSDIIRKKGIDCLDFIEFKNCNQAIQTIITIVIDYMQDSLEINKWT